MTNVNAPHQPLPSVPVAMTPLARFEEYLQTKGQRQTEQRRFLIGEVFKQHDHFDADDLVARLPDKGQPNYVSPATVYRTLKEFVDAGLLVAFRLEGRTVYEFDYGYPDHDHLYCTECQRLVEFQSQAMEKLRDETATEHGFRVTGHHLIITGVCRPCAKSKRRRRKQDLV